MPFRLFVFSLSSFRLFAFDITSFRFRLFVFSLSSFRLFVMAHSLCRREIDEKTKWHKSATIVDTEGSSEVVLMALTNVPKLTTVNMLLMSCVSQHWFPMVRTAGVVC